jgi:hypothetical protein
MSHTITSIAPTDTDTDLAGNVISCTSPDSLKIIRLMLQDFVSV